MALNKLNIVLADDDLDDQMLFEKAITASDIETSLSMFEDGQKLMNHLHNSYRNLPDLVFLDLNMPNKNGLQCLQEIRNTKELENLCVVIYSTSSSDKDIEQAFIDGANIYLSKPSNFSHIRKSIEKVLRMHWQYATSNLNRDNFLLRL